jgi:hypothetical protein
MAKMHRNRYQTSLNLGLPKYFLVKSSSVGKKHSILEQGGQKHVTTVTSPRCLHQSPEQRGTVEIMKNGMD